MRIRRTLNIESGLNDGIATPFVSLFIAFAISTEGHGGSGWLVGALAEMALMVTPWACRVLLVVTTMNQNVAVAASIPRIVPTRRCLSSKRTARWRRCPGCGDATPLPQPCLLDDALLQAL